MACVYSETYKADIPVKAIKTDRQTVWYRYSSTFYNLGTGWR